MRLFAFSFLAWIFLGSCERDRPVEVSDPAGAPVAGVRLRPVHEAFMMPTAITDAQGRAVVQTYTYFGPTRVRMTHILVDKEGYASQSVKMPDEWPLKIVLQPDQRQ
jgi:hypothetical protein